MKGIHTRTTASAGTKVFGSKTGTLRKAENAGYVVELFGLLSVSVVKSQLKLA